MSKPLRIVVHDYAGYAFPLQLSRWLADRGHAVLHLHCTDVEAPRGAMLKRPQDSAGLQLKGLSVGRPLPKYRLVRRWFQELSYGRLLGEEMAAFQPDVVLSANTPPATQARLAVAARRAGVPLICWVQDIFSLGAAVAVRKWPAPLRWGALRFLRSKEFSVLRKAEGLVLITEDFAPLLAREGVENPVTTVIENWAPVDEIKTVGKDNAWAREHGLNDRFVFLYAGTLGMKHNPALIADLARAYRDDPDVRVAVVSQGPGRAWLSDVKKAEGLNNLLLFDYQPFSQVPEVLASGDALLVLLEDFAGVISAPSKTYAYFCAERPILAAVPPANIARRLVEREKAGLCVDAADRDGFLAAARRLREDADLRARLTAGQREYAKIAFDMERIGARFSEMIRTVAARGASA